VTCVKLSSSSVGQRGSDSVQWSTDPIHWRTYSLCRCSNALCRCADTICFCTNTSSSTDPGQLWVQRSNSWCILRRNTRAVLSANAEGLWSPNTRNLQRPNTFCQRNPGPVPGLQPTWWPTACIWYVVWVPSPDCRSLILIQRRARTGCWVSESLA
jgi:hypothetical protein